MAINYELAWLDAWSTTPLRYDLANIDAGAIGFPYDLSKFNAMAGATTYRLASFDGIGGERLEVTLGPVSPPRFDPFELATLTAASVIIPNSWTFEEIDGFGGSVVPPTVTLTGTGGQRTYRCPGLLFEQVRYFRVTVELDGAYGTAEVRHSVAPHAGRFSEGGIGRQYHSKP